MTFIRGCLKPRAILRLFTDLSTGPKRRVSRIAPGTGGFRMVGGKVRQRRRASRSRRGPLCPPPVSQKPGAVQTGPPMLQPARARRSPRFWVHVPIAYTQAPFSHEYRANTSLVWDSVVRLCVGPIRLCTLLHGNASLLHGGPLLLCNLLH